MIRLVCWVVGHRWGVFNFLVFRDALPAAKTVRMCSRCWLESK